MSIFTRMAEASRAVLRALISSIVAALFAIMILQIVFRYGFNASLIWAEEVCRYLLIWVSFLAAFLAYERGEIAAVTLLRDGLGRRAGLMLSMVCNLIGVVLLLVLAIYGWRYAAMIGSQPIPALRFIFQDLFGSSDGAPAMFWVYLALPVGMGLLAIRLVADIAHYVVLLRTGGHAEDLRAGALDAAGVRDRGIST